MTVSATSDVHYDPYDVELNTEPYAMYHRLREEAPLYYNNEYDFYALSRFADVHQAARDHLNLSSARGDVLETVKANMDIPSGFMIFEDPPIHDIHRKLLSRMFRPRKIAELEPQIREFCARCLDPLVGGNRFAFVADLGAKMPMRVIGMLLGMPEGDQEAVRKRWDDNLRSAEAGQPINVAPEAIDAGEAFAEYIDWRAAHPSDDIITELSNVEFEDETGTVRRLTPSELRAYASLVVGAGNETTNRLIGWMGKVLAENPTQRRQLAEDHSLIPQAIEEFVRYEPSGPNMARYVTNDVEYYGQTIPAGSVMLLMLAAANRDDRQFPHGDVFDIHREPRQHLGFGTGIHFCLGSALARLEGRVALEEILKRFPEWDVDLNEAKLAISPVVRGWESMPAILR
ncbi:cytochrome P450 [Mycobacterium sp. pUA109]|uniref:cytochrome P450 n=1 Tax=Mycobacterium sp. pUA109 TaxID=3238982 RepID=UPI00351AFD79